MSAVERAVARGESAQKKWSHWKPVGVDNPGWLTARIEDTRNGSVEGVFYAQGQWQWSGVHRTSNGEVRVYTVRDAEVKRIAKAMIQPPAEEREALLREVATARRARIEAKTEEISGKRRKR